MDGVPNFLEVYGKFEEDYFIAAVCRNGKINLIKAGKVAKATIDIESKPVCTASI